MEEIFSDPSFWFQLGLFSAIAVALLKASEL